MTETNGQTQRRTQQRLIHAQVAAVTVQLMTNGRVVDGVFVYSDFCNDEKVAEIVNGVVTKQPKGLPLTRRLSADDVADIRRDNVGKTQAEIDRERRSRETTADRIARLEFEVGKLRAALTETHRRLAALEKPQLRLTGVS